MPVLRQAGEGARRGPGGPPHIRAKRLCVLWLAVAIAAAAEKPLDRAIRALELNKSDEAIAVLAEILTRTPRDPAALGLMGAALDLAEKYEEAEDYYRWALELTPESIPLLNNVGNHYLRRNDPARARGYFERVLRLAPDHQNANIQMARIALETKDGKRAAGHLARVRPLADPAFDLLRAETLHWTGRRDEALALIAEVRKKGNREARIEFSAGMSLSRIGRYAEAVEAFSRALATAPTDFEALYNLGLAAAGAGQPDRAERAFQAALRQRPGNADALLELGRLRQASGAYDEAILLLTEASKAQPQRAEVQLTLARALESAAFYGDAAIAYDRYLALRPGDAEARRDRALVYGLTGSRMPEALSELEWYIGAHPKDPVGHLNLGLLAGVTDQDKALAAFSRACEVDPKSSAARYARGALLHSMGRSAEALPDLEFVARNEPANITALDQLGLAYLTLERPKDAEAVLRRAYGLAQGNRPVALHFGRALSELGRDEDAGKVLEAVLGAQQERPRVAANPGVLDFLSLSAGEQRKRAIANLESAIRTRPADPALKTSLGRMYLAEGRTADASAVYRDLLALRPDARLAADAGRTLLRAGVYDLAAGFFEIASVADPQARIERASALLFSEGAEKALTELEAVPEPARASDYYLLQARALDSMGRKAEAVEALTRGLRSAPASPRIAVQAAELLIRNGRAAAAVELLDRVLKTGAQQPDLLLAKAVALNSAGRSQEVEGLLRSVQARWPEWGRGYLAYGVLLRKRGRAKEAAKALETAALLGEKVRDDLSLEDLLGDAR